MRYSSRFFLYAPFVGLLVLTAIACIHWWMVAGALAKRLDAVNGQEIMPGVRVAFAQKRIAGFPFRMDVLLKGLRIEVADVSGPVVWSSEEFAAHALTYGREQTIFEAAGRQSLSWIDGQGRTHRFIFLPGTFRASAILQKGVLVRFDAAIADLDGADFRAANVQFHFRMLRSGGDIYLRFDGAHVAGGYAASLGPQTSTLIANASIEKASLLTGLLRGEEAPAVALEEWRNNGGSLATHDISVIHAGRTIHYHGAIALDAAHDFSGTLAGSDKSQLRFDGNRLTLASGLAQP